MGSTFVTKNRGGTNRVLGANREPEKYYLQFVPGVCVDVITSESSARIGKTKRNINSILAIPHILDSNKMTTQKLHPSDTQNRYYPLMRGMVDVPTKGDPVLLCTIGGIQYYMGPLNTANDPNYNIDLMSLKDYNHPFMEGGIKQGTREQLGLGRNFIRTEHKRLQKKYIKPLDNPHNDPSEAYNSIHGDMVFEGRHGNSIRIGSRYKNPYLFISNARSQKNSFESFTDGSLIGMVERGSLRQHFGRIVKPDPESSEESHQLSEAVSYTLSDENELLENTRTISSMLSFVNSPPDETVESEPILYGFGEEVEADRQNQLFQIADRITFDARSDNIFLSAFKNIYMGSGENLLITTKNDVIIESRNIYLGKGAKIEKDKDEGKPQPLVLGEQLVSLLTTLIEKIGDLYVTVPTCGPSTTVSKASPPNPAWNEIVNVKNDLATVLSRYHYIENNEAEKV